MTSKTYRKWLGGAPVRVAPIREGARTRTLTSVTSQSKVRACNAGRYQKQGDVIGNVVNAIHSERVTRIRSSINGEILQQPDLHAGKSCNGRANLIGGSRPGCPLSRVKMTAVGNNDQL
jgi:hypothetical protein